MPVVRAASLPDPVQFSRVVELGDIATVREWLDKGLSPNFEGQPIGTGVMIAAWTGNIPMMELFVARGADVNKTNALGEQALLHAAWRGQKLAIEWLLGHGAKISREGKEWAALHYAAFAGHADVVKLLLNRGADVNALSTNGSTPLMMAAREGREAIAAELLQAGANPEVRNEWGDNAETWALRQNNQRIAKLVASADPALRKPVPVFGPAQRSQPVNEAAEKLLARARQLEAQGRRDDALKAFRAALNTLRVQEREQEKAKTKKQAEDRTDISGLRISAKRGNPESQTASLSYDRPATSGEAPKLSSGGTVQGTSSLVKSTGAAPQDPVERLLNEARAMDAQGKRLDAIRLYRQAAELLRSF